MSLITVLSPERTQVLILRVKIEKGETPPGLKILNKCKPFIKVQDWVGLNNECQADVDWIAPSVLPADYAYIFGLTPGQVDVWLFLIFAQSTPTPPDTQPPPGFWNRTLQTLNNGQWQTIVDALAANNAPFHFTALELQNTVDPNHTIQTVNPPSPPEWTIPITWTIGTGLAIAKWTNGAYGSISNWVTGAGGAIADWTKGAAGSIENWTKDAGGEIAGWAKSGETWVEGAAESVVTAFKSFY
jgi:hypothetical protein